MLQYDHIVLCKMTVWFVDSSKDFIVCCLKYKISLVYKMLSLQQEVIELGYISNEIFQETYVVYGKVVRCDIPES